MQLFAVPYMNVTLRDKNAMKLNRSPPLRSWLVFLVMTSIGLYCAYESKHWVYGSFFFLCGVSLGYIAMDRWEECSFDKSKNRVALCHYSLYDVILHRNPSRVVVSNIDEIVDVRIESEKLKYAGTTYNVALVFDSGYSLALTSTGTYGNKEVQEVLAGEVRDFLNITKRQDMLEKLNATLEEHIAKAGPPPGSAPEATEEKSPSSTKRRKG